MGKRILLIDDNERFLKMMDSLLASEGYDIITLGDPIKTEDYIEEYRPDLLIIDIFMPGRTGFNIIEDFSEKGMYSEIPKIFLTGLDDDVEKSVAKSCGISYYITKPFQPDELLEAIETIFYEARPEAAR
ncbi:MAG: response regulator [Candidatus Omnitrophota bacterium]